MKKLVYLLSFSFVLSLAHASIENSDLAPLTEAEAKVIIEQQMSDKAFEEARRKTELEAMPATSRRVIQKKDHQITINRVTPPALKSAPAPISGEMSKSTPLTRAEFDARVAEQPKQQSISLSATVFDEDYSKVLWRKPHDANANRSTPGAFEIWVNLSLNNLSPISSFQRDDVVYNYFGITQTITHEDEAKRSSFAKEWGYDYESRWQHPPVEFTEGQPEYVVTQPADIPVPLELYQQMDALLAHYLENEARLKTEYLNIEALKEAKKSYLMKNPPQAKDVVINFYQFSE